MTSPRQGVPEFKHEIIDGASGPCKAYRGQAAAVTTFNGIPIIIMAATRSRLVDAIKEISPDTKIEPTLFMAAGILHDHFIKKQTTEDDEL